MTPPETKHPQRCGTCKSFSVMENGSAVPSGASWPHCGDNIIPGRTFEWIEIYGCASHSDSAERRIQGVIAELERRKTLYPIPGRGYSVGKIDGFDEAITLLRGDGK